MTADRIAEVVADIRAGHAQHPAAFDDEGKKLSIWMAERARQPQPIVDCTAIFDMQRVAEVVDLYDDYPSVTPPWTDSMLCYVNTFGNVIVMQVHLCQWDRVAPKPAHWFTENEVDWSSVQWIAETSIWVGGSCGDGSILPTSGPCHMFRHAITDNGTPVDINWLALMHRGHSEHDDQGNDPNRTTWEASLITLNASLNFLNASNVDIAEPARPRPMRRRIARTGVQVQTIVVRPPGKRRLGSGGARPIDASENVLSPVRGHFARYGIDGRGLLFGKLAGKFWIPGHVRGAGTDSAKPRDYVLKPNTGQLRR